jgi:hypothetical protein
MMTLDPLSRLLHRCPRISKERNIQEEKKKETEETKVLATQNQKLQAPSDSSLERKRK